MKRPAMKRPAACKAQTKAKAKASPKSTFPCWQATHQRNFQKKGLAWPVEGHAEPRNKFTEKLTQRCLESLIFDEKMMPRGMFGRRFLMLGQSLGRGCGRSEIMPCLIPKGQLWERTRQGPVYGMEQLEAQGMDAAMAPAAREFPNHVLVDIAGNRAV